MYRQQQQNSSQNQLPACLSRTDSLAALRDAKAHGVKVLGIVNVVGSSISREADSVMYTWAGPEIAVATTKAYSSQLIALYLLAMNFAQERGTVSEEEIGELIKDLIKLPEQHRTSSCKQRESPEICQPLYCSAECILYRKRN